MCTVSTAITIDTPGATAFPDGLTMTDSLAAPLAPTPEAVPSAKAARQGALAQNLAVLEQLATLYPKLFGAQFLPLKRGIFQDLLQAHPDMLQSESLKSALAFHTRSTRYLVAVASGLARHDLQGQPVETMAPEHVHHAVLEVFRRRQGRSTEDLRPKLRERILRTYEASGLSRTDYTALVSGRDELANAVLEEALNEAEARAAKDEALLRAFETSGQTPEAFADMYGLSPRTAAQTLERAKTRRANSSRSAG
jgi:sRNA-binding protein